MHKGNSPIAPTISIHAILLKYSLFSEYISLSIFFSLNYARSFSINIVNIIHIIKIGITFDHNLISFFAKSDNGFFFFILI